MAILSLPFSWRTTLLLLYLVANLKSLPFAWHVRLLYQYIVNFSRKPVPPKSLPLSSKSEGGAQSLPRKILSHPIFAPTQISTHSPLLEIDYNLHKSNSTYFTDMDISRTQLVTRLYSPGFKKVRIQLDEEGYRGRMMVALGSVHVTFRREIGIYERVGVRSRVLGWDGKWLVVVSYFVRMKGGGGEELCAVGLSKYVVKKGRFTVKPERVLRTAGWLPEDKSKGKVEQGGRQTNDGIDGPDRVSDSNPASSSSSADTEEKNGEVEEDADEGLRSSAPVPEFVETVVLDENAAVAAVDALSTGKSGKATWNADVWSWEEIEDEKERGMQLARGWLGLDVDLCEEFEKK